MGFGWQIVFALGFIGLLRYGPRLWRHVRRFMVD